MLIPLANNSMIQALERSIKAKRIAINSLHIPANIITEMLCDIELLEQVIQICYISMDSKSLFI